MRSGYDLPGQMEGDPVRYAIENEVGVLEDVEVLLVQGDWSLVDDKLWAMESIKAILKFEAGDRPCSQVISI